MLEDVDVLLVEIHPSMIMHSDADLVKFAAFFSYVFMRSGFRVFWQHPNTGSCAQRFCGYRGPQPYSPRTRYHMHPVLLAFGLDPYVCCYELGLVRPPQDKQQRAQEEGAMLRWFHEAASESRVV